MVDTITIDTTVGDTAVVDPLQSILPRLIPGVDAPNTALIRSSTVDTVVVDTADNGTVDANVDDTITVDAGTINTAMVDIAAVGPAAVDTVMVKTAVHIPRAL